MVPHVGLLVKRPFAFAPAVGLDSRAMKTIFKIAAGIIVACVVLIGGCAVLIGAGADKVQRDSDKTAITYRQYESVNSHDTLSDVKQQFGVPQSADDVDQDLTAEEQRFIRKGEEDLKCVYYNRKGHLASIFQFCFDGNGRYRSKSAI